MYNANEEELKIIAYWKEHRTFEKSVSSRPENKPYVFYDGPPFATGLPHYGHILSSVIKDVVPRYFTMQGYRVRRRWGWDCHGLPIESLIEKELKISGKKQIEEMGVNAFNEACRSKVLMYTHEWKKMVERIGRWIEFDNAYQTMDPTYMESVWWALKTIWDQGRIYEGRKVLLYCTRCETPVSKAETTMDNSYKDVTEESVTVKFKIKNPHLVLPLLGGGLEGVSPSVYMLAWTTTPWTLPGNVALAVGTNITYMSVTVDWIDPNVPPRLKKGETYVFATTEDADKRILGISARHRNDNESIADIEVAGKVVGRLKNIHDFKGSELVGLEYEPLFELSAVRDTSKKAYYVTAADFVTTDEGTGIVHTAVIYGEDDYNLGLACDLPMVPLLDSRGHFNDAAPEAIRGEYLKKAEKEIKQDLETRGLIFSKEQFTHSYPHCWRCDTPLIYNAISAWFINIQQIKHRLIELNEKINWYPDNLKHGRFLNILETAPDWNISRNRYWATPLPFWKCHNMRTAKDSKNEKCENVVCVGSIAELKKKAVNFDEVYKTDNVEEMDLHKQYMDRIILRCEKCDGEMKRIPEVIDCWVEAASMPFAEFHYPFENKDVFKKRFPGQYIAEYIAQTRAWFYYMHVMGTLLFESIAFEHVVTTGTILNERGEKMSKSKMNYPDPWIVIGQYGMDALRYHLLTSVVMQADNLFFNEREVREVYNKVINILWNVVAFYQLYTDQTNVKNLKAISYKLKATENVLDRWILAKLQNLVNEVTDGMSAYDTVRAGRPIKEFIDDLSTWYLRRSRERFKSEDELDKQAALATLHEVLLTLAKLMAPFMPFMAEKIYQELKGEKKSVHLEDWPTSNEQFIDESLLEDMATIREAANLIHSIRKEKTINTRQPIHEASVSLNIISQAAEDLVDILKEETNIKKIKFKNVDSTSVSSVRNLGKTGWMVKDGNRGIVAAVDPSLTDELKREGLLREIIRVINQMRKEAGLTVQDRITVVYHTDDSLLAEVVQKFSSEIKKVVLADKLENSSGGKLYSIDDLQIFLSVRK